MTSTTPARVADESLFGFTITKAQASKANGIKDLSSAVATVRDQRQVSEDAGRQAMWNLAALTHHAVSFDIGKKGKDAKGNAVPAEGKRWAEQKDYAAEVGISAGYVTSLKRLGRAIVVHGIRHGSKEWTHLCSNVDAGNAGDLRKALDSDDSAKVREILSTRLSGRVIEPTAKRGAAKKNADEKKAAEKAAPKVATTADDMLHVIAGMSLSGLSDAGYKKVRAALLKKVKTEDDARATLAAKAAKEQAEKEQAEKASA